MPSSDKPEVSMHGIKSNEIDIEIMPGKSIWDLIEPMVEEALEKGEDGKYSVLDVRNFIRAKDMQLWLMLDDTKEVFGCAITQLISYPNGKRLVYFVVAGKDISLWFDNNQLIEDWAKKNGCLAVEFYGRKGWERFTLSKEYGYEPIQTVYRKAL